MTERSIGKWGFLHIAQCEGFVTNGMGFVINVVVTLKFVLIFGGENCLFKCKLYICVSKW